MALPKLQQITMFLLKMFTILSFVFVDVLPPKNPCLFDLDYIMFVPCCPRSRSVSLFFGTTINCYYSVVSFIVRRIHICSVYISVKNAFLFKKKVEFKLPIDTTFPALCKPHTPLNIVFVNMEICTMLQEKERK